MRIVRVVSVLGVIVESRQGSAILELIAARKPPIRGEEAMRAEQ